MLERRSHTALAGLILLAGLVIFFSPVLFGRELYFFQDLKRIFLPIEHEYRQRMLAGELPQWSPFFVFGQPLLAWGQWGFFALPHVLGRLLLPPLALLNALIIFYVVMLAGGTFIFARKLGWPPPAALLSAAALGLSGFVTGHLHHINFLANIAWIPWGLWLVHSLFSEWRWWKVALLGLLCGHIFWAGHGQLSAMVVVLILSAAIWCGIWNWRRWQWRIPLALLLLFLLTFKISSLYLSPVRAYVPESDRADGLSREDRIYSSYPPYYLATWIFPTFFGDNSRYWGPAGFQSMSGYIFPTLVFLACFALLRKPWQRNHIFWLLLGIGGALLAMGGYTPLYDAIFSRPPFNTLAIPSRFLLYVDLALALLAGSGLRLLLARPSPLFATAALALTVGFFSPVLFIPSHFHPLLRWRELIAQETVHFILLIFSAFLLLSLAFIGRYFRRLRAGLAIVFVLITFANLIYTGRKIVPRTPRTQIAPLQPLLSHLDATRPPARLYADDNLYLLRPFPYPYPRKQLRNSPRLTEGVEIIQAVRPRADNWSGLSVQIGTQPSTLPHQLKVAVFDEQKNLLRTASVRIDQWLNWEWVQVNWQPLRHTRGRLFFLAFHADAGAIADAIVLKLRPRKWDPLPANVQIWRDKIRTASPPLEVNLRLRYSSSRTYDREWAYLAHHLSVFYQLGTARWLGSLPLRLSAAYADLYGDNVPVHPDDPHSTRFREHNNLLSLAGVKYVVLASPKDEPEHLSHFGYSLQGEWLVGDEMIRLYENPAVLPRAFLVQKVTADRDVGTVYNLVSALNFRPHQEAIVQGRAEDFAALPQTTPAHGKVVWKDYRPEYLRLEVDTPTPSLLVVAEAWAKGWTARIDGSPAAIVPTNLAFRGVLIPAGKHTVEMLYRTPGLAQGVREVKEGIFISVLLVGGEIIWRLRRAKTKLKPAPNHNQPGRQASLR
jgi:hypothetical protein